MKEIMRVHPFDNRGVSPDVIPVLDIAGRFAPRLVHFDDVAGFGYAVAEDHNVVNHFLDLFGNLAFAPLVIEHRRVDFRRVHVTGPVRLRLDLEFDFAVEQERHIGRRDCLNNVVRVNARNRVAVEVPRILARVLELPLSAIEPISVRLPVPVPIIALHSHVKSLHESAHPQWPVFLCVAGLFDDGRRGAIDAHSIARVRGGRSIFSRHYLFLLKIPRFFKSPIEPGGGEGFGIQ
jgi:hypothetical protein